MKTTKQALKLGFVRDPETESLVFRFGDKTEYELAFEPLIFDNQMYVALYKNKILLTEKVVVKRGYEEK